MGGKLIFDFADPGVAQTWYAIDDRVMGGVSRSRLRYVQAGAFRLDIRRISLG